MKQTVLEIARVCACVAALFVCIEVPARAQSESPLPVAPGQTLFNKNCASCHVGPPRAERAPDLKTMMELTPESVLAALTTGNMVEPALGLSDDEKRAIAEYLGGRPLDPKNTGDAASMTNRCPSNPPPADPASGPAWNGWSASSGNSRFANAATAGLSGADVPKLKLKWAFGFPNGDTAFGQPAVVGGRIYVGAPHRRLRC